MKTIILRLCLLIAFSNGACAATANDIQIKQWNTTGTALVNRDFAPASGTTFTTASGFLTAIGGTSSAVVDGYFADPSTNLSFSASAWRTDLGLVIGTNAQAWSAVLDAWALVTDSSGLRGRLSDETGTGFAVFATSPTITTPILTTPTISSQSAAAATNWTAQGGSSGATYTLGQGASGVHTLTLPGTTQSAELQSSSGNVQLRVGDSVDGLFMGAQGQFHARRQSANPTIRTVTVSDSAGSQGYLAFDRARGTFASAQDGGTSAASAVQSGDVFGGIVAVGHDGDPASMQHGAQIDFVSDGLWSATNRASSISFKSVAAATTSQVLAMTLRGSTGTFGSQVPTWTLGTLNVFASADQSLRVRGNGEISVEAVKDNGTFGPLRLEGSNVQLNPVVGGNIVMGKTGTITSFPGTTASTSTTTGAVTIAGGLGLLGDAYYGSRLYFNTGTNTPIVPSYVNVGAASGVAENLVSYGSVARSGVLRGTQSGSNEAEWDFSFGSTGPAYVSAVKITAANALTSGGLNVLTTTASTTPTTGSIIAAGGVGVAGAVNVGGALTVTGETTIGAGGIAANGGGLKHGRVTTGSISAGSTALATLTWSTPFADANYTPQASVVDSTTSSLSLSVVHIESFDANGVSVRILNNAVGSLSGTLCVVAIHD